jgi:hypothetical protein
MPTLRLYAQAHFGVAAKKLPIYRTKRTFIQLRTSITPWASATADFSYDGG